MKNNISKLGFCAFRSKLPKFRLEAETAQFPAAAERMVIIIKKLIAALFVFILLCLFNSPLAMSAAKDSLLLWSNSLLPAFLPFFIASQMLYYAGGANMLSRITAPFMRIFSLPAIGGYAFLMSVLCGYPAGSRICALLYEEKQITGDQCARLSVLCHTSGPIFIFGSLSASLLGKPELGIVIFILHLCAAIITGVFFNIQYILAEDSLPFVPQTENTSIGGLFAKAVSTSINSVMLIGGYIVFFGIFIKFIIFYGSPLFSLLPEGVKVYIISLFSGGIEVTHGLSMIASLRSPLQLPLICLMLSFSGLCIVMQSLAFLPSAHIKAGYFIKARFLCGAIAFILCILYQKTALAMPILLTVLLCVSSLAYKTVRLKNSRKAAANKN